VEKYTKRGRTSTKTGKNTNRKRKKKKALFHTRKDADLLEEVKEKGREKL